MAAQSYTTRKGNLRHFMERMSWTMTVVLTLALFAKTTQAQQCDSGDSNALLAFKADFIDSSNLFVTWTSGTNCCTWTGVTCNAAGRVQGLNLQARIPIPDLPDPNRSSTLPVGSSIGSLTALVSFVSPVTTFNGPIPGSWADLTNLSVLRLTNTGFSGTIPDYIGNSLTKLTVLALLGGSLTGSVPSSLCNLKILQELRFEGFFLTGSLPSCLGTLTTLQILDFTGNRLSGRIPTSFGRLTNLQLLLLTNNQFTGRLPSSIGGLTSLTDLDVGTNMLSGPLPGVAIGRLTQLQQFFAGHNNFSGVIPPEIGNLVNLQTLDLSYNNLRGPIPRTIGNLVNLFSLMLEHNRLSGPVPAELGNVSPNHPSVDISYNSLSGVLPNTLFNIGSFIASHNRLTGGFPLSLTRNAQTVDLSYNRLNSVQQYGTVPNVLSTLVLSLAYNRLAGPIPSWLLSITSLTQLDISSNRLTGPIPVGLYVLPSIVSLNISNNPLNTMLSVTLNGAPISSPLTSLDLHNDQLYGPVPSNFLASFPSLTFLDLSANPRLTGTVPHIP